MVSTDALQAEQIIAFVHGIHRRWESRPRPAGAAPKIPVSEIGGATVSVGLLVPAGEGEWLREALEAARREGEEETNEPAGRDQEAEGAGSREQHAHARAHRARERSVAAGEEEM